MKSYEEKAYSALKRIEEETEYRRKRKKNITRILTPVMSLCLAAILGIGIWQSGMFEPVSYTHLDVYKRQGMLCSRNSKSFE